MTGKEPLCLRLVLSSFCLLKPLWFLVVFFCFEHWLGLVNTCGVDQRASVSSQGLESGFKPGVSVRNLGERQGKVRVHTGVSQKGPTNKGYQTSLIGSLMS